jgi:hypothetical protein
MTRIDWLKKHHQTQREETTMLLMRLTHEITAMDLAAGRVHIMSDTGSGDVLVTVHVPERDGNRSHVIAGWLNRGDIALAMEV